MVVNSFTLKAQESKTTKVLPAVGTSSILGKVDGIAIEAMVQSPSNEETPLQVVCLFEYTEGDIFTSPPALPAAVNGMVHVDKQLNGLITDLRKSGKFAGHALETLLIIPPKGTIPAKMLLLIGLGKREDFKPDLMIDVGRIGMREALRLGVSSYAHASDLKDGGIDSPTALVADNVVQGALDAYETDMYLQQKNAATRKPLTKVTLLAGQAFYEPSGNAIKEFILNYKK
jgi:hypothetical protein